MLLQLLEQKRETILKRWIDQTIQTYEPEMVRFLKKEKNQFANPVRSTVITCLEKIYSGILKGIGVDECWGLEEIIKLRAVQDFSPSSALSFLFAIKKIVREELENSDQYNELIKELCVFEERIDTLIGMAFDIYTECREKIYEIRLKEINSRSQRAFEILERQKR
jgi:hypothetical protein